MYTNLIITFITMHKSMPKFYEYNGQKYSICFPIEWATNHFEETGPFECMNCLHYGCTDDIFTNYCLNCQEYEYHFTRIPGNNVTPDFISVCNYSQGISYNDNIESDYDDATISNISDISETFTNNTTTCNSSVLPLFTYTDSTYMPDYNNDCNGQLNLSPYSSNYGNYTDYDE